MHGFSAPELQVAAFNRSNLSIIAGQTAIALQKSSIIRGFPPCSAAHRRTAFRNVHWTFRRRGPRFAGSRSGPCPVRRKRHWRFLPHGQGPTLTNDPMLSESLQDVRMCCHSVLPSHSENSAAGRRGLCPRENEAQKARKKAAGPLHPAASPRCPEARYRSRSSSTDRAALRAADFASPFVMPVIEKPLPSLCPDTRKPVFTRL